MTSRGSRDFCNGDRRVRPAEVQKFFATRGIESRGEVAESGLRIRIKVWKSSYREVHCTRRFLLSAR